MLLRLSGFHRKLTPLRHTNSMPLSIGVAETKLTSRSHSFGGMTKIKPWPVAMVECDGDYRSEVYLEAHIGGPLYSKQSSLPRLPIPDLKDTIDRFLPTALPLAESEEEVKTLKKDAANFVRQAISVQSRLYARKDEKFHDSSWLQQWWNQLGYLQVRDPVVINVSYFFHLADDPTLLPSHDNGSTDTSVMGIRRGAAILYAVAEFRRMVVTGSLPTEMVGRKKDVPLCSVGFKYMFNACRIPRRIQDSYRIYDPSLYKHAIVARKGQFFAIEFVDGNGNPLAVQLLEKRLDSIIRMADENGAKRANTLKLGWLTSQDRDLWADGREGLIKAGGERMKKALKKLESGAFLLCLDDEVSHAHCRIVAF